MKKFMVMVAVAMMTAMNVNAQSDEPKNEISISYGAGCLSTIGDGLGNAIGNGIFDQLVGCEWKDSKAFGSIGVEYFRHLDNPRLAVGGIVTFASFGEDVVKKNGGAKVGERTRNYISLMPSVKYYWVNGKNFGFYSKAAVGATMLIDKRNDNESNQSSTGSKLFFTGQVSPIGLEAGSTNVRAFMEAGFGEQGILLAGLRMKF